MNDIRGAQIVILNLTYEGDDSHPETCSVRASKSFFALKGRIADVA